MKVAIIGTGYVGLTTGVGLAFLGHDVVCVDADTTKVSSLKDGKIPIYEPFLKELMVDAKPRLDFTASYAAAVPQADVVFIAVGTPSSANGGAPDLRYLEAAAKEVGANLGNHFTVIVNKSTVPIGSGNWVTALIRDAVRGENGERASRRFAVASNPEFLREGSAVQDTLYPDRIVVGAGHPDAIDALESLYRPVLEQTFAAPSFLPRPAGLKSIPFVATDLASAELTKYAANAFLALKISYINEIGQLAENVGADISQVARAIGLDSRIGPLFLKPGIGWGGSCFGKDTAALVATAEEYGLEMEIVKAAREVNRKQRRRVLQKITSELKILKGRTIGILGLAFKPDTDDLREAPALDIAKMLTERGATVKAHDPIAMERFARENKNLKVCLCSTPEEVATGADALLLATEWPQYRNLDWENIRDLMRRPVVLDGRHLLDGERLRRAGLTYLSSADRPAPENTQGQRVMVASTVGT